MFELRPESLSFLDTAPRRITAARTLSAKPETVFYALAAEPRGWREWFKAVSSCEYGGEGPYGVGTRRRVRLRAGLTFHETLLAWDSPSRYSYRVDRATVPGLRALVERWDILETSEGTRLSWTMGVDATLPVLTSLRGAAPGIAASGRMAMAKLDRRLEAR